MDHEQRATQQPPAQSPVQTVEDPASRPQALPLRSERESNGAAGREARSPGSSMHVLQAASEGRPAPSRSPEIPYIDYDRSRALPPPPPARSRSGHTRASPHRQTVMSNIGLPLSNRNTGIDWIVPVEEKGSSRRTVGERLQPTIDNAVTERDKYAKKALWTGYALNIAIGLQVFLSALTTGLAAAVTGRKAQLSTSILGGLSTMVASYLARARGSGEPELSIARVKDLEQYLRECRAFQMDHAHEFSTPENGLDFQLEEFRRRFEELLGNASGERKLSPVGITPHAAA